MEIGDSYIHVRDESQNETKENLRFSGISAFFAETFQVSLAGTAVTARYRRVRPINRRDKDNPNARRIGCAATDGDTRDPLSAPLASRYTHTRNLHACFTYGKIVRRFSPSKICRNKTHGFTFGLGNVANQTSIHSSCQMSVSTSSRRSSQQSTLHPSPQPQSASKMPSVRCHSSCHTSRALRLRQSRSVVVRRSKRAARLLRQLGLLTAKSVPSMGRLTHLSHHPSASRRLMSKRLESQRSPCHVTQGLKAEPSGRPR